MKKAIDNFSINSEGYSTFRPSAPPEIFDFLYGQVNNFDAAWDCGTGNGQVAAALAERFGKVYATDISAEQLKHAFQKENIAYMLERAEATSLPGNSVSLVTVAQAIHWFDFENFYEEVERVTLPGAIFAAWTYTLFQSTPAINKVINHFHDNITGPYWNKESELVNAGYRTIPFPFAEIQAPQMQIVRQFTYDQLIGLLYTWSGVRNYMEKENNDPVSVIEDELRQAWGSDTLQEIVWPIHVRCGRVK